MSFVYPRTIAITRPAEQSGVGAVGYGGLSTTDETPVASDVEASIQARKDGAKPGPELPGDTSRRTVWRIFFKLPKGTVKDRDFITDDEGIRYQVTAAYWNSLGYAAECERLEA